MSKATWWGALTILAAILWASSSNLGHWLIYCCWSIGLVLLFVNALAVMARQKPPVAFHTALGAPLVASVVGPLIVHFLQQIGTRIQTPGV